MKKTMNELSEISAGMAVNEQLRKDSLNPVNVFVDKSIGHVCFVEGFEYFIREGELFLAPLDNVIMPDGRRCGRWEAPSHMVDSRLKMLGIGIS